MLFSTSLWKAVAAFVVGSHCFDLADYPGYSPLPTPTNQAKYAAENTANAAAYASNPAAYGNNIQRSVDEKNDYEHEHAPDHDSLAGIYALEPTHMPAQDLHARSDHHGPEVLPKDPEPFDAEAYHKYHGNLHVRAEDHEDYKLDRMQALAEVMHADSEHAYHIARSLKDYLAKTEPHADIDMRSPEEAAADEGFMQLMASGPDEDAEAEATLHTRDADEDFFQHLKGPEVEAEEAESNIPNILARGLEFLHLKDPRIEEMEAESRITSDDDLTARGLHDFASPRIDDAEAEARLAALDARSPTSDETRDEAFDFEKHNYGFPATLTHPASLTHPSEPQEHAHIHPGMPATSGQTGGGKYIMRARALPSISLPPTPVKTQTQAQTSGLWKDAVAAFLHKHGGEWNAAKVKPHARAFREDDGEA